MLFRVTSVALVLTSVPIAGLAGGFGDAVSEPIVSPGVTTVMPVQSGLDWSGYYVGGSYGMGQVLNDSGRVRSDETVIYGLHAGRMWDLGNWVLGAEAEFHRLDMTDNAGVDANALRTKGRVGYDLGRILPYATMGGAVMGFTGDFEDYDAAIVYGGGVDFALTDNIILGAEVLQHDVVGAFGGSNMDVSAQTLSLRASFQF